MKFTSLFSAVLVFALSAVNAESEPAVLQVLSTSDDAPPEYRINATMSSSLTSFEMLLSTKEPNGIPFFTETTSGVAEYNELPIGKFDAIINDNNATGYGKTFRIDLSRPGVEFHYEGTSVTDESIDNLLADANIQAINGK